MYGSEQSLSIQGITCQRRFPRLHRTMARPFFSIDRISHFDIFDRHAETTITLMRERFSLGLAVDFQVRALA